MREKNIELSAKFSRRVLSCKKERNAKKYWLEGKYILFKVGLTYLLEYLVSTSFEFLCFGSG